MLKILIYVLVLVLVFASIVAKPLKKHREHLVVGDTEVLDKDVLTGDQNEGTTNSIGISKSSSSDSDLGKIISKLIQRVRVAKTRSSWYGAKSVDELTKRLPSMSIQEVRNFFNMAKNIGSGYYKHQERPYEISTMSIALGNMCCPI